MRHSDLPPEIEHVASIIVNAAVQVHRALGPGLLESTYEHCLTMELELKGLKVQRQVTTPLVYRGRTLDPGYRIDMLVDHSVVVENKSVEVLLPVHESQVLTYLKMGGFRLGFLLNWFVPRMSQGIRRFIR
jgi:GxxExxY protein